VSAALRRSLGSLAVPNYRRYFTGQVVSLAGNWMQTVAETWLVLKLTGNGALVGLAAALQFLPIMLGGAWGGLLADRLNKRRLLMTTQSLMALPALALFVLVTAHAVQVWQVLALIFVRGSINAIDNPARQSFVFEMVGGDRVVNAVSLNSVIVHTARIAGPAAAGVVIAVAGVGPCFLVNALSFAAMLVALHGMDPERLHPAPAARRAPGQLREALRYVRGTPALRTPLLMMAVVGTLSFNFQVLLPLLARFTWDGTATTYAVLTSAMGVGSVIGALASGARGRTSPTLLAGASLAFGALTLAAAGAPVFALQVAVLVPLGAASVTFAAGVNSSLQLAADPGMRGRVMALYSVVFLGSTPIGAPIVGWVAEAAGARAGLLVGGTAALLTGAVAWAASAGDRADVADVAGDVLRHRHGRRRVLERLVHERPHVARAEGDLRRLEAHGRRRGGLAAGRSGGGRGEGRGSGHEGETGADRHGAGSFRRADRFAD
jgi:MFS family permease